MNYDFTIISRFRNKERVDALVDAIRARGHTCYNFCDIPADPNNPEASADEQSAHHESVKDFWNDPHFQFSFDADLDALKSSETIILLLPAGTASHIEAGIAYGLGKKLVLIGEPEKPETLYLIFKERYATADDFLLAV